MPDPYRRYPQRVHRVLLLRHGRLVGEQRPPIHTDRRMHDTLCPVSRFEHHHGSVRTRRALDPQRVRLKRRADVGGYLGKIKPHEEAAVVQVVEALRGLGEALADARRHVNNRGVVRL